MSTMTKFGPKQLGTLLRDLQVRGLWTPEGVGEALWKSEVRGISADSETVGEGELFVCIKGLHRDGHAYIKQAKERGAIGVVTARACEDGGLPQIRVSDTRAAFAVLCDSFCGHPSSDGSMKIIAVTGTNGKTTTAHMLRAILEENGRRTGIFGTVTNTLTTPDPDSFYPLLAEMRQQGVEYVCMEASSHALALGKLAPVLFEVGIFLNLTPEHLDFHGDMKGYLQAKQVLMRQSRLCLVNSDSPYGAEMARAAEESKIPGRQVRYFSLESDKADYRGQNNRCLGVGGIRYDFQTHNRMFAVDCPIPGSFTFQNSLAAVSCAYALGVPWRAISEAMRKMKGVPGRMERLSLYCSRCAESGCCAVKDAAALPQNGRLKGEDYRALTVLIDYAHTPDALEKVLRTLRELRRPEQKLTVLFGCGGDRDRSKRAVMGGIASRLADTVIVTGDNSRSEDPMAIIADILKGIDKERSYKVIPDRAEAITYAVRQAEEGEIILLAGKGHEMYEINADGRRYFDEREIVRKACADCGKQMRELPDR